jgi:hypothetical protein
MRKKIYLNTAVIGLVLALSVGVAAPQKAEAAVAYPQNKCFLGYLDLNDSGFAYAFSFVDFFTVGKGRICSAFIGKCGALTITGEPTSTRTTFKATFLNDNGWLAGGSYELSGQAERKGPGGVFAAVAYVRDEFYSPTGRYGATFEGWQVACP